MAVTAPAASDAASGSRFPALAYRDFRIIWFGMFFASATMMFQFYAQGWFLIGITSSVAMLGVAGVSRGLGMLLFSMYGGALADRMDQRTLLIATQSCAFAIYALLSALVIMDAIALWQTFVLIFFAAAVEAVDAPARQALIPHLVPRENIGNAVALLTAAQISAFAYLPPLAGVAIDLVGVGGAFAISLSGHAVVIGALLMMRVRPRTTPSTDTVWQSIGEGVRYSAANRPVLWIILISIFIGVLGFPLISTLAPYWMRHELGLGPMGWTVLGWTWGLGTVVASVGLSAFKLERAYGKIFILSAGGFAASLVVFGLTRSLPLVAASWAINGMFFTANIIVAASLLQMIVPALYIGRVTALRAVSASVNQMSAAPLGALADGVGISRMVPSVATFLMVLVLSPWAFSRAVRGLDETARPQVEEGPPQAVPTGAAD
jgi:MFS family permease